MKLAATILAAVFLATALSGCDSNSSSSSPSATKPKDKALEYEIWSSPINPIAPHGHSIAFSWETGEYLYWFSSDVPEYRPNTYPRHGTFYSRKDEEIALETILGDELVLEKIDLQGTEALAPKGEELELAIRDGRVLLNRRHGDIENPWALPEDTEFETTRIKEILQRAEQGQENAGKAPE